MTPTIPSLTLFEQAISAFRCKGGDTEKEALNLIGSLLLRIAGSSPIPVHDYKLISYVGSTNNIDEIVYKIGGSGGDIVATRTFTYVNDAVSDDDLIETDTIV